MAIVPIENVTVTAFVYNNETQEYLNVKSAVTDIDGKYELKGLFPGRSYVFKFEDSEGIYLVPYFGVSGTQWSLEDSFPLQVPEEGYILNMSLLLGAVVNGIVTGEDGA